MCTSSSAQGCYVERRDYTPICNRGGLLYLPRLQPGVERLCLVYPVVHEPVLAQVPRCIRISAIAFSTTSLTLFTRLSGYQMHRSTTSQPAPAVGPALTCLVDSIRPHYFAKRQSPRFSRGKRFPLPSFLPQPPTSLTLSPPPLASKADSSAGDG